MKIRLCSDLHLNHYTSAKQTKILDGITSTKTPYDLLAVCGDVSEGPALIGHLRRIVEASAAPVVFVPGNHDFSEVGELQNARLRELEGELEQFRAFTEPTWLAGNIAGCTYWYPYNEEVETLARAWGWYDYRMIPDFVRFWKARNAEQDIFVGISAGAVVLSHMLPSFSLVHPVYREDKSNVFFVNPKGEDLIQRCKPKAWLFGHTHKWTDAMVHDTRCIARPYGYPRESEKIDLKTYHEKATFDL